MCGLNNTSGKAIGLRANLCPFLWMTLPTTRNDSIQYDGNWEKGRLCMHRNFPVFIDFNETYCIYGLQASSSVTNLRACVQHC